MEEAALKRFPKAHFVLVDPSEKMLEQAKIKLRGRDGVDYILGKSTDIGFEDEFEVVTAFSRITTWLRMNVLEKCGYTREGLIRQGKMVNTWCDYYIYGILSTDLAK